MTNPSYTITAAGGINENGTVYLDYPDIGISQMEVIAEGAGKRTVRMTLYNCLLYTSVTFNEFVDLRNASVTINGKVYSAAELSMDDYGVTAMLWYPVQDADCLLYTSHEIYMSDARRVVPEKWKTVIRHPVRKL